MSDIICYIIVRGKVHGVGYRAWLAHEAEARGLAGWVRNRKDRAVEALLSGPEDDVLAVIEACKRGPAMARVSAVDHKVVGKDMMNLRKSGDRVSILPNA